MPFALELPAGRPDDAPVRLEWLRGEGSRAGRRGEEKGRLRVSSGDWQLEGQRHLPASRSPGSANNPAGNSEPTGGAFVCPAR